MTSGLEFFRPYPSQLPALRGLESDRLFVGNNRSGKSLLAAVDTAMFALGVHPWSQTHQPPVKIIILAATFKQVGEVIFPLLFAPGAFMLPDGTPAPPLIPPEEVRTGSWEWATGGRRGHKFTSVMLRNGTTIIAHTAVQRRKAVQGFACHRAWQDEELGPEGCDLYVEVSRGLASYGGRFLYSCCPIAGEEHLANLHEASGTLLLRGEPKTAPGTDKNIAEYVFSIEDNPAIGDVAGFRRKLRLARPDEYEMRAGEFEWKYYQRLIYPGFDAKLHVADPHRPPESATIYESIDPGFLPDPCAVGFYYVLQNGRRVRFDEVCETRLSAAEAADRIKAIRAHHGYAEPAITWIDAYSAGRTMGCPEGLTAAFAEEGIHVVSAVPHDKENDGIRLCSEDLAATIDGEPRFAVTANCTAFIREISRYIRKDNGKVRTLHDHCMDEWRNAEAGGLYWTEETKQEAPARMIRRTAWGWMVPAECIPAEESA